jgi:hypothetical protein
VEPVTSAWDILDNYTLVAAEAGWDDFLAALRDTSHELFDVIGQVQHWRNWLGEYESGASLRDTYWHLAAGELDGRSYIVDDTGAFYGADRVALLAERLSALVIAHTYNDSTTASSLIAARGAEVLRYTYETQWGDHFQGAALPGEGGVIDDVFKAHGFDPEAWLDRGRVLGIRWRSIQPDDDSEQHRRLYSGPLRQAVDHIEQAALADLESEFEDDEDDEEEEEEQA